MVVSEATGVRKHVPNDQEKMSWWTGFAQNSKGYTGMMSI